MNNQSKWTYLNNSLANYVNISQNQSNVMDTLLHPHSVPSLNHNILNNLTTSITHGAPTCEIPGFESFLVVCYFCVFIIGVCGNSLVLLIFAPSFKKGPIIELLILYLAFFDLLASIFGPFVFIYWMLTCYQSWHFSEIGCKLLPAMSRIFTDISIGIILTMAIDRCRSIVTPFRGRFSRRTIHISVIIVILLSIICEYYYINALYVDEYGRCTVMAVSRAEYSYPLIILTSLRNIAFIIIFSVTTLLVYSKLTDSSDMTLLNSSLNSQTQYKRRKRVMKMLVVMAIVFALCVTPRDILHLAYTISWMSGNGISFTTLLTRANGFLKVLQVSNSIYNVFIYGKMHAHFWTNLKISLLCKKGKRRYSSRTARLPRRRHGRLNTDTTSITSSMLSKRPESCCSADLKMSRTGSMLSRIPESYSSADVKRVHYKTKTNGLQTSMSDEVIFE